MATYPPKRLYKDSATTDSTLIDVQVKEISPERIIIYTDLFILLPFV